MIGFIWKNDSANYQINEKHSTNFGIYSLLKSIISLF